MTHDLVPISCLQQVRQQKCASGWYLSDCKRLFLVGRQRSQRTVKCLDHLAAAAQAQCSTQQRAFGAWTQICAAVTILACGASQDNHGIRHVLMWKACGVSSSRFGTV